MSLGTPRKILVLAAEAGAHADCIAADVDGACPMCRSIVQEALHATYGKLGFMEAVMQIMIDVEES